ncbi:cytochrome P450 2D14-like [Haliotis rufescens]|uniref:cytochrome P450 2D14-like n=1 Tax=Haliotis rufescens TaxID=6454 RepID=UPI001EAF90BE|nr:cytochrome P450 2D14-like [Haliotis rufescens]
MLVESLTSTTVLVFVTVLLLLRWLTRRPPHLPPGPVLFPLLGNLLSLGPDPRPVFRRLRKAYGDIFCVFICHRPVVVLNGYDVIRDAVVKNGDVFSNRPHSFFSDIINDNRGIMMTSGKMWKEQRTFALTTLREFGMGRSLLEEKIQEETEQFLNAVAARQEEPQDLKHLITNSVSNIICSIVFGRRFEYTDPRFVRYLEVTNENIENLQITGILQILPFLRHLPGDAFRLKKTVHNVDVVQDEFIEPMVQEHIDNYDEGDVNDFIAAYIKEMRHRQQQGETTMEVKTLLKVIMDLFVAGSETTSTAIRWVLALFLNYPDVQDRCFREIDTHIGVNRRPGMKDKISLPYVEATIMETLRYCDIAPLAAPHCVARCTQFRGYTLPEGASVMVNLDSVLQDQGIWGDPQNFRPDRFLDSSGKVFKPEEFIPFSIGHRVCLGESLARMELFLFVTALVQTFHFTSPGQPPTLEGVLGLTYFPKPFEVIATPRT